MSAPRGMARYLTGGRVDPLDKHRHRIRQMDLPKREGYARGFAQYLDGVGVPEDFGGKDPVATAARLAEMEGSDTRSEDQRRRDAATIARRLEHKQRTEETARLRAEAKAERQRKAEERGVRDRGFGKYI